MIRTFLFSLLLMLAVACSTYAQSPATQPPAGGISISAEDQAAVQSALEAIRSTSIAVEFATQQLATAKAELKAAQASGQELNTRLKAKHKVNLDEFDVGNIGTPEKPVWGLTKRQAAK